MNDNRRRSQMIAAIVIGVAVMVLCFVYLKKDNSNQYPVKGAITIEEDTVFEWNDVELKYIGKGTADLTSAINEERKHFDKSDYNEKGFYCWWQARNIDTEYDARFMTIDNICIEREDLIEEGKTTIISYGYPLKNMKYDKRTFNLMGDDNFRLTAVDFDYTSYEEGIVFIYQVSVGELADTYAFRSHLLQYPVDFYFSENY